MRVVDDAANRPVQDQQVECVRCGYNLTGIDDRRPCPECGLLGGFSRLDKSTLGNNHPRSLAWLTAGAVLVILALIMILPALLVMFQADQVLYRYAIDWTFFTPAGRATSTFFGRLDLRGWLWLVAGVTPILLTGSAAVTGLWLLTGGAIARSGFRWPIRCLALVVGSGAFVALLCTGTSGELLELQPSMVLPILAMTLIGSSILSIVFLSILLGRHLRMLAERAPAPLLMIDSPLIGIAFAVTTLLIIAVVVLNAAGLPLLRSEPGLAGDLSMIVLAVLIATWLALVLWWIYLLVRYALAFLKARRQALALFQQADQASATRTVAA